MSGNRAMVETAADRKAAETAYRRKQMAMAAGAVLLIVGSIVIAARSWSRVFGGGPVVLEATPEMIEAAKPDTDDIAKLEAMSLEDLEKEVARRHAEAARPGRAPEAVMASQEAVDRAVEVYNMKRAESASPTVDGTPGK